MILRSLFTIAAALAIMFYYNWQLTLITLGMCIPNAIIPFEFGKVVRRLQTEIQKFKSDMTILAEESY